jgi:tRNA-specific 2-thiouridylase
MLKKHGYKVIGAFMKNFSETKNNLTGECAWVEERKMAQKVASLLEIPLITLDFEEQYKKKVITPMFNDYKKGLTPNPDTVCNAKIKFPLLWKEAKKLGADYIATGHYARIKKTKEGFNLLSGKDKNKDQSYFLHDLTQKDLEHTLFPLGNYTKEKVRKIAKQNHFPNYDKQGTRGICFVGKVNMKSFLEQKIPNKQGKVILFNKEIGTHAGTMYYTIGQRIGPRLGIILNNNPLPGKKLYVTNKLRNSLIVAPEGHPSLKKNKIIIKNFHLINPKEKMIRNLKARVRHLGKLYAGKLTKEKGKYLFKFDKPIEAIAEGQSIVLYYKDNLVASGEIRIAKGINNSLDLNSHESKRKGN